MILVPLPLLGHFCIFPFFCTDVLLPFFFSYLFSPQFFSIIIFLLLHELSMESHIHILPLPVLSFPFWLRSSPPLPLACRHLPPSVPLSQPFSLTNPILSPNHHIPQWVPQASAFLFALPRGAQLPMHPSDELLFLTCTL